MSTKLWVAAAAIALAGCAGHEEEGREIGEPVFEDVETACGYLAPGWCMSCGYDDGKTLTCRYRESTTCSHQGRRTVRVSHTPMTIYYKSGAHKRRIVTEIDKVLKPCS